MGIYFNLTTKQIADILDGEFKGDSGKVVSGISSIDLAEINDITFFSDMKYLDKLKDTRAGCIIVDKSFDTSDFEDKCFVVVANAHNKFAKLLIYLAENYIKLNVALHESAIIDNSTILGNNINIGARCTIGSNCRIADDVYIYPHVVIYDNVTIDSGTIIHSNAVICSDTFVGKNCLILPGAVIGSEGFGFLDNPDGSYTKIPQLGNVIIEDDVEIGANTTIDRAVAGSTIVSKGVKLDNLIQIGHNCRIGENTAMASQTGVSGSSIIGKRNKLGGQVGIAGHLTTADDVIIMAQSGVAKSVEKSGAYFGSPIRDRLTAFKIQAVLASLPDMAVQLHQLKKKLNL